MNMLHSEDTARRETPSITVKTAQGYWLKVEDQGLDAYSKTPAAVFTLDNTKGKRLLFGVIHNVQADAYADEFGVWLNHVHFELPFAELLKVADFLRLSIPTPESEAART